MIDKSPLRTRMRCVRKEYAATRGAFDPPVQFTRRLASGMTVATYAPTRGEADPRIFDLAALAALCDLALPFVVDRATPIRFLTWPGNDELTHGPWGLRQPAADNPEVSPDIILTPLIAFDRAGNRLGQGAGHYDRAFTAHPAAWRVGIGWSVQEVDALPTDPWDVPLHAVATEKEWITPLRPDR